HSLLRLLASRKWKMPCSNGQSIQAIRVLFPIRKSSIPDEERLFQQTLSSCAGFRAEVVVVSGHLPATMVAFPSFPKVICH
ncbi:MAG TPA: hypothetical protein VFB12_16565, partial [Ktedonobacteraceae bacterium]|nr:hypothetical protein [Ktedonobacteraceae bacterium]